MRAATIFVVGLLLGCLVAISCRAGDLPDPWSKIETLSPEQKSRIQTIISQYRRSFEEAKARIRTERTTIHQHSETTNLIPADVARWSHQTSRVNQLLERRDIMQQLSPEQQGEADRLWRHTARLVEIDGFEGFKVAQENNDMWCWAASIAVVLNYNGVPWSKERVAEELKGQEEPWSKATTDEIEKALQNMKLSPNPAANWNSFCTYAQGSPEAPRVVFSLDFSRPLLVALNGVHVGVLHKASYKETANSENRTIDSVVVYDPQKGRDRQLTWSEVEREITGIWYAVVSKFPNDRF